MVVQLLGAMVEMLFTTFHHSLGLLALRVVMKIGQPHALFCVKILLIMKDNWITTGDGDSYSEFRGLLYLSEEDMAHWQDVVLEKIRSVKSEKLQEYVKRNPYITIAALFYRGWEMSQEDYDLFVNDACAEFWDAQPVLCKLDLGKKRKRNIICIGFAPGSIQDWLSKNKNARLRQQSFLHRIK